MTDELNDQLKNYIDIKKHGGNDDIYYKEIIKNKLLNNHAIIHVLNNKELDEESPDDYYGQNIFPYYLLFDAQTASRNYIFFETSFQEIASINKIMKLGQIIFYIVCDEKNIYDKNTGIALHDLLGALVIDDFNWCSDFGTQFKLVSDKPGRIDNNYVTRVLTFEQVTPNSITQKGVVINTFGK